MKGEELFGEEEMERITKRSIEQMPPRSKRCVTCKHRVIHYYNKNFSYCGLKHSNKTSNGLLKIKPMKFWCEMHEQEAKE